ncbi:hypothetical protein GCM10009785_19450 [Brooklawnia cerclae]
MPGAPGRAGAPGTAACRDIVVPAADGLRASGRLSVGRDSGRPCVWVIVVRVTFVPLIAWPVMTLSIILIVLSVILTAFILLHKGRGGGLSDLFGGGMTTGMSGTSVAERNLDRLTVIVGLLWVLCIIGLLVLYRVGI